MENNISYKRTYSAGVAIVVATAAVAGIYFALESKNARAPVQPQASLQQPAAIKGAARDQAPMITAAIANESAAIKQLYERSGNAPLWLNSRRLKDLTEAAGNAQAQGINTSELSQLLMIASERRLTDDQAARADVVLTKEALHLAEAIRLGAVPTEKLGSSWLMTADSFDAAAGLGDAIKKNDLREFFAALAPKDPQYKQLVAAFAAYGAVVQKGGWTPIPAAVPAVNKSKTGRNDADKAGLDINDPRMVPLRDRLAAEAYLSNNAAIDAVTLTEAVKTFQERNGLDVDGQIGRETLAALNVSAEDRLAQIAANLERWRHTPRERGEKFIAVNTAATTLDYMVSGESTLHLRVVTGTKGHATPILSAKITAVTLNPRWEIPPSIARNEILPHLQKDPNYLASHNMVVVDGDEGDPHGQYVDWSNVSAHKLSYRFRQRAGDDNALGLIKFQMSNPQNIYLHDTPSRSFFARSERHLSHGCVRVEQPTTLAEHVLMQTPGWDAAKIDEEIAKGTTRSIGLKQSLPVHISYWTVFSENGVLNFRNDIYERDLSLAEALGVVPPQAAAPTKMAAN